MAKKKNEWLYRVLCAALAVTLVSGAAVMSPVADIIGTSIVAEALSSAGMYNLKNNYVGTYLDAGTEIVTASSKTTRTTIYLNNSIDFGPSTDTYTTPSRVRVDDAQKDSNNVYIIYLTTAKLDQSPTISAESKTYDGNAVSYDTGTGYGTCTVNFTGINDTSYDSSTAPSEAGDYRMTVSYAGDGNYKSWSGTADFTISKATPVMYEGYTEWTGTGTDENGNSATVTCYWKIENGTLYIKGIIPNTVSLSNIPWRLKRGNYTSVYAEPDTKTSANASYLFKESLATEMDLSNLDTSATTNMSSAFYDCTSLKSLDLSGWKTEKVTNMVNMFSGDMALETLIVNGWNTENVTNMSAIFKGCNALTSLDLSDWNTSSVTDMSSMFSYCNNLQTIYVGDGWYAENVSARYSKNMFYNCSQLVGGAGTTYDNSNPKDKTYAHIDGGEENPGYFSAKSYTVTWMNEDGTELGTNSVANGTSPVYSGATPTKEGNAQYTYTFSGWTSDGGTTVYTTETLPADTEDVTYTAVFESTVNTYTVIWKNDDGNNLKTDTVAYGETPVYSGDTPTKTATAQYSYTFSGWDTTPVAVTGNATYTAQFTETTNTYTVTWQNEDGTVLETDTVAYGETPTYDGAIPTKESTTEYRYIFSSWTPSVDTVTGNVAYTATFTEEGHFIDDTHHAWYTFDKETGHMEIYGDGQAFKKQYAFGTFTSSKPNTEVISVHLNNDNGEINTKDFTGWFQSFIALKSVTGKFPAVVDRMGSTFYNCRSLTYVEFVPEVTVAATKMFCSCTKLSSIGNADNTIKISCTSYQGVFQGCYLLNANVVFNKSLNAVNIEKGYYENAFENAAVWGGNIVVCMTSNINDETAGLIKSTVVNNTSSKKQNISYHHYSDYIDNGDGTHIHTCDVCGEAETENHTFDNGICTVCSTKEDYTIKITNGIVAKGEKDIYHVGDIITLKANTPEEGKVFAYWQDGSGNVLSTKANYSFVVLQSVDLTAVYNNEHTAKAILNISAVQTSSNGKNAIRFVFTRSVDTTAEVEEVGLIYATNKLAGYTSNAKVNLAESEEFDIATALKENTSGKVKNYKGTSTSINGAIRLTYTIGNNTDCYVYAYGYVKLTDGTTLYTDLIATTYDSIV